MGSPLVVAKPLWTGHVRGLLGEMAHDSSLRAEKSVPERKRVRLSTKDSMNEQYFAVEYFEYRMNNNLKQLNAPGAV